MLVKFILSIWKPDNKVITRSGQDVRIICTDYNSETGHSIIGLVKMESGKEDVNEFMEDGSWLSSREKTDLDLFIEVSPKFNKGDLIVNKEGILALVGDSDCPRKIESIITINPKNLVEQNEESLDPDGFRLADEKDWEDFKFYLGILGLKWDPKSYHLYRFNPSIDFSPLKSGWEITYENRKITITDKEYLWLKN